MSLMMKKVFYSFIVFYKSTIISFVLKEYFKKY